MSASARSSCRNRTDQADQRHTGGDGCVIRVSPPSTGTRMGYLETMKRLALSLALMIGLAAPAMADRVPLSQLSRYLNGIGTAEGDLQDQRDAGSDRRSKSIGPGGCVRIRWRGSVGPGAAGRGDSGPSNAPGAVSAARDAADLIVERKMSTWPVRMVIGHERRHRDPCRGQDPDRPEIGTIELTHRRPVLEQRHGDQSRQTDTVQKK